MKNEQILKQAIEKAFDNGYGGYMAADWLIENDKVFTVIFSHSFAKAFWGDHPFIEDLELWNWQYHLQQMVLEEEPLKYIERFL